jgi:hypothetical protein
MLYTEHQLRAALAVEEFTDIDPAYLIHNLTGVKCWDLRPTDWHRIWPDLVGSKGAPKVTAEEATARSADNHPGERASDKARA